MNEWSRSLNSKRNLMYGMINKTIVLILQFLSRTMFIYYLGTEYLGVNGLYGNVLNVLSLAELGIDGVIQYSLYAPIANNDKETLSALLQYFKKIYRIIALSILVIGLFLVPFLPYILDCALDMRELILYYILFLTNSVFSYLIAYKTLLIKADQNAYIIDNYTTTFTIIRHIAQTVFLIITRNYTAYLAVQIICTILLNVFLSNKANKLYPFIKNKVAKKSIDKNSIKGKIGYAFLYRTSNILIGNTDNILISVLVGTTYVGYYSNYSMFIFNVSVVINMLVTSVFSSFGNLYASGDKEKSYVLFKTCLLAFQWIGTTCSLCFMFVFNDFITLWIGKEYVLPGAVVFVIVLNFYNEIVNDPLWLYRETMGLFKEISVARMIAAGVNIVLSVVLGIKWGLFGILLATLISKTSSVSWYEPEIVLKKLGKKTREYWKAQGRYIGFSASAFCIAGGICMLMGHGIFGITMKLLVCVICATAIMLGSSIRTKEFQVLKKYISGLFPKKRNERFLNK